jgi:hypothetical protein
MAKRKKRSKRGPADNVITITVPKEWEAFDQGVIEGIVQSTLGHGASFGITEVIVQTQGAGAGEVPLLIWDKYCN